MYLLTLEVFKKSSKTFHQLRFVINSEKGGIIRLLHEIKKKYDLTGVKIIKSVEIRKLKEGESLWIPEYLNSFLVLHNE